jgi:nitroreductase/FMN reductase [NAD(P)H]
MHRESLMEANDPIERLQIILANRFGERLKIPGEEITVDQCQALAGLAGRASHREWLDRPVAEDLVRLLAAVALSAPSKSDLQQTDIVVVKDNNQRARVQALVPSMPWIAQAPVLMVVCGNGARFRRIFERQNQPFANDHLDAFFNASTDASMVLMHLLVAAGAVGLTGVPISVLRDQARQLSRILELPRHVFPVAGLCLGYPASGRDASVRMNLKATIQVDRYSMSEDELDRQLDEFDRRYQEMKSARLGDANGAALTWSEEKRRQYAVVHRSDWGEYIRRQGYILD